MKRSVIIRWSLLLLFLVIKIELCNANGWLKDAPLGVKTDFWATAKSSLTASNDSGFYSVVSIFDTIKVLCGTDTCNNSGFDIIKYNNKGNIIWKKPFSPDPNLLQHPLKNDCFFPGPQSILFRNYSPQFIINTSDNSGLIVYYGLEEIVSGQCGCFLECLPITSNFLHYFYAKFDYNGNVIWSQKEINNNQLFTYADGYNKDFCFPEYIGISNQNYINTKLSFNVIHKYYDSNLDSITTDLDTLSNIISVDTTIYYNFDVSVNLDKLIKTTDDGLLMFLSVSVFSKNPINNVGNTNESYLLKLNANNEKEWIVNLPKRNIGATSNLLETDNKYYVSFRENNNCCSYAKVPIYLFSIDKNGNNNLLTSFQNEMNYMHLRNVSNTLQLIGSSDGSTDGNNDNRIDYSVHFIQFDNNDSAAIIKEVKMPTIASYHSPKIIYEEPTIDLKNGSSVFGFRYEDVNNSYNNKSVLVNIDSIGNVYSSKIFGTLFGDKNNNCTIENSDAFLRNYALRAINQTDSFYTSTDTLGNYEMYLDSGNYQMQLLPNPSYPLWQLQSCTIPNAVHLNDGDSAKIDIGLSATISCTNLTVSLTAPMLRRCFQNTYYVNYCNNGTVNATNSYIDVSLDHFLDFNTSAQSFTNLGNNVFRFNIGNVETGKCGAFSFDITVNCDSTFLGQTHCSEAHIFPDTVCSPIPYTGAIITAAATCKTNSIEFKLKNIGGNMQIDRKYIVIQDQVLRSIQNYNLPSGNELIVSIPLQSGSTYRIEAEQPLNFPSFLGDPKVAAFIEGCRTNSTDTFATGFITQFPLFDGEPYKAIDCQQNRGSYDPNDKAAMPIGVGVEHFIDKNIPLKYTIRFQNTGNDTAFSVSIIDTISANLNINSIVLEASSHACRMIRIDTNVIQFLFENIKLVDSTTNLNASNGFVQFHIQQKNENTIGTIINNSASIYFDYNAAIITNNVFHTIGENYLRIDLISSTKNDLYKNIDLSVFPNPFNDKTTLIIKNATLKNALLILFDVQGNEIEKLESNNNSSFTIYRNQLNAGIYFYKLMDNNTEVATGKIIVQ